MALFVAIAAVTAAYSGLLAWNRATVAYGGPAPDLVAPPALERDAPDGPWAPPARGPGLPAQPAPASFREPRRAGTATVQATLAHGGTPAAGVGLFDGDSGALLAWRDLPREGFPLALPFENVPAGEHELRAGPDARRARYAWTARTRLRTDAQGEHVAGAATIDVGTHSVAVELVPAPTAQLAGVIVPVLRRTDDPGWRPPGPPPVRTGPGSFELSGLGAGDYELELDGADVVPEDAASLRFAVPQTTVLRLRCGAR